MSPRLRAWLIWLASIILGTVLVLRTEFTADMSAFLPKDPTPAQALLVDQLRDGMVSRLILVGLEGGDAATRAELSHTLVARLGTDPVFSAVQNGGSQGVEKDRELLFAHRYLLSPAVSPERFSAVGLHAAIADSIANLSSSAGLVLKQLLPRDPTGETLELVEQLQRGHQPASADGVWASQDGQRTLLLAYTRAKGSDMDGQAAAIARLEAAFAQARTAAGAPAAAVRLLLSGPGVFALHARETIRSEVTRLSLVSTALIASLLLAIYRSVPALLLGLIPVATGALAAIAVVGLGFGMVHGITLGFGITLIGEAVDYAIYLFVQGREPAQRQAFWPTIRLGVLTSMCGFAALLPSGFPGLAQLGLFSITGILVAALVTRFLLPQMLPPRFAIRDVAPLGRRLQRVVGACAGRPWLVVLLAVAAAAVLFAHRGQLWNHQLGALSPVSQADQALDARLRGDLGAPDVGVLVVVQGSDADAALAAAEAAAPTLRELLTQGIIAGFESPANYVPSRATQAARQAALPAPAALAANLDAALRGLPLRADKLAGFRADVEAARHAPLLSPADFAGSAQGLAVEALLSPASRGGWNAILPLRAPAGHDIDLPLVRAAFAASPDAVVLDLAHESQSLYRDYLGEALRLCAAGLAAILLLLALSLGRPARVLRVALPLAAAVLVVCAGLILAGVSFTLLHLIGMLLIVAVGSNYALFFERDHAAGPPQPATLASLLFANLTTVAGFGLLGLSTVPVLSAIGTTVGPGAVLALLFSALLAPVTPARSDAHTR